jgi:hypothetical protein
VGRRSPPFCRSTSPPRPPPTWAPSGCPAPRSTPSLASTPTPLLVSFLSYLQYSFILYFVSCSVVEPDPVGSETLAGSGDRSGKNHSGSEPLWIRNEFEVNYSGIVIIFDNFSTKMIFKKEFCPKNIPSKAFILS